MIPFAVVFRFGTKQQKKSCKDGETIGAAVQIKQNANKGAATDRRRKYLTMESTTQEERVYEYGTSYDPITSVDSRPLL
jgi:hypothetical protein